MRLLDPVHLQTGSKLSSSDGGASPMARSRSCESAWVILDYGVSAEQGTRRTMEDQHTTLAEGIPFFGVYDGHGGTQCAEYLRDNLHTLILSHPEIKTNPEKAIRDGIIEADRRFLERCVTEKIESGSVCAVALFIRGSLVVGNVGDCEAVLCRGGEPLLLTVSHNPRKNAQEAQRVEAAGGRICRGRVGHPKFNPAVISLAVSRAIGDAGFRAPEFTDGKASGIIATPDTRTVQLTAQDEFLIIGCDGLWDVMEPAEAVRLCRELSAHGSTPGDITERLIDEALQRGSTDNVTAVFVACRPSGPIVAAGAASGESYRTVTPRINSTSTTSGPVCRHGSASASTM